MLDEELEAIRTAEAITKLPAVNSLAAEAFAEFKSKLPGRFLDLIEDNETARQVLTALWNGAGKADSPAMITFHPMQFMRRESIAGEQIANLHAATGENYGDMLTFMKARQLGFVNNEQFIEVIDKAHMPDGANLPELKNAVNDVLEKTPLEAGILKEPSLGSLELPRLRDGQIFVFGADNSLLPFKQSDDPEMAAVLKKCQPSIGRVESFLSREPYGTGTGFQIKQGVISNFHVVNGIDETSDSQLQWRRTAFDCDLASIEKVVHDDDLVMIKPKSHISAPALKLRTDIPKFKERYYALGYGAKANGHLIVAPGRLTSIPFGFLKNAAGKPYEFESFSVASLPKHLQERVATVDDGQLRGNRSFDRLLIFRMTGISGMSGGPIVDANGSVVSVTTQAVTFNKASTMNTVIGPGTRQIEKLFNKS